MASYLHCVNDEEPLFYELAKALRRQHCALLIGLGLSLPIEVDNKLPQSHLKELLARMVQWGLEKQAFKKQGIENNHLIENDDEIKKEFDILFSTGDLDKAELKIQEYINANMRKQCISEVLLQSQREVRHIYRLLANMPFRAFFATGFDEFLEEEYKNLDKLLPLSKYYKNSLDAALSAYKAEESFQEPLKEPFIVKLHGDITRESLEVLTLSNRIARTPLPEAIIYPQQLRELLGNLHTLFIGFDKADPDLQGLQSVINKKDELKRWLLIPNNHLTEQQAESLWNKHKIITLCYANRSELAQFLTKLEELASTPQQIEVYVSYALEDNEIRDHLQDHLGLIEIPGLEITWSDGKVGAGQMQKSVIEERLQNAQVILLLLSVSYLKSVRNNLSIEMKRASEREQKGTARVIPIIVRSCQWKDRAFGRLAALPLSGIAIDLARNRDEILDEVARGVATAIKEWGERI